MDLPAVTSGAERVCTAAHLSLINIDAACSHVAVLPRLSLTIVAALVHNRPSLLFISQGRITHSRPLTAVGGGAFVSLDAREDLDDKIGGFTIAAALAGGQDDAAFNVSRGDFTLFEGTVGADWEAQGSAGGGGLLGGMTAASGQGGALCILRSRVKTRIEEQEQFVGGSVRPPAAKFKVWIAFEEPYYQRCTRDEQMQGVGILHLAACAGVEHAAGRGQRTAVVACVSGAARAFLCGEDGISKIERMQVHNAVRVRSFPRISHFVTDWHPRIGAF